MNIHYQHNAQPLSLMEHPHQTKVVLFESLKAWLEAEMVAMYGLMLIKSCVIMTN